jgi:ArsR family transcriptional regulator, virulence genes transcriptional regulator
MIEMVVSPQDISTIDRDNVRTLRDEMAALHARFCRGLGDPKRLLIIAQLKDGELTVSQLAHQIGAAHANTSQHLSMMRDLGLVLARRVDNNVFYRLSDPRLAEVIDLLRSMQADLRNHPSSMSLASG